MIKFEMPFMLDMEGRKEEYNTPLGELMGVIIVSHTVAK